MFAEDVNLLPDRLFQRMLEASRPDPVRASPPTPPPSSSPMHGRRPRSASPRSSAFNGGALRRRRRAPAPRPPRHRPAPRGRPARLVPDRPLDPRSRLFERGLDRRQAQPTLGARYHPIATTARCKIAPTDEGHSARINASSSDASPVKHAGLPRLLKPPPPSPNLVQPAPRLARPRPRPARRGGGRGLRLGRRLARRPPRRRRHPRPPLRPQPGPGECGRGAVTFRAARTRHAYALCMGRA